MIQSCLLFCDLVIESHFITHQFIQFSADYIHVDTIKPCILLASSLGMLCLHQLSETS